MTFDENPPVGVGVSVEMDPQRELRWVLEEAPGAAPLWRLVASLD